MGGRASTGNARVTPGLLGGAGNSSLSSFLSHMRWIKLNTCSFVQFFNASGNPSVKRIAKNRKKNTSMVSKNQFRKKSSLGFGEKMAARRGWEEKSFLWKIYTPGKNTNESFFPRNHEKRAYRLMHRVTLVKIC